MSLTPRTCIVTGACTIAVWSLASIGRTDKSFDLIFLEVYAIANSSRLRNTIDVVEFGFRPFGFIYITK
jgi:hypothetical protein